MFSRLTIPLVIVLAATGGGPEQSWASQADLTEIIPRTARILIVTAGETADLREAGNMAVTVDRALRGRGRRGETLVVGHNGSPAAPKFEEGRQYLMLLQPSPDGSGWVYVADAAMPVDDGKVVVPTADAPDGATVSVDTVQMLLDRHPLSPDALLALRTSLAGRWSGELVINGKNVPLWVLDVTETEGDYSAELLSFDSQFSEVTLESFEKSDDTVKFHLDIKTADDASDHTFDFVGRLADGVVVGTFTTDGSAIQLGRLRATAATEIDKTGGVKPCLGSKEFENATVAEDEFTAYEKFGEKYAGSPLAIDAYMRMLQSETARGLEEAQINDIAQRLVEVSKKWGEPRRRKSVVDAGIAISEMRTKPELAQVFLTEAESFVDENSPQSWQTMVPFHMAVTMWDKGNLEEATQRMEAFHKDHPLEPRSAYYLAHLYEEQGKTEEAMRIYAALGALPKMPEFLEQAMAADPNYIPPEEKLHDLWQKEYGASLSKQQFHRFVADSYRQAIQKFAGEMAEPRPAPDGAHNRTLLVELFTGGPCQPCVAADLATTGMEIAFPRSDLIVLRYHVTAIGPDPLLGPQNEERMAYYQATGTPTIVFNGKPKTGGGYVVHAQHFYEDYMKDIEPALKETSDIELKISAEGDADGMYLSAEAIRLGGFEDNLRLRMAVVENGIPYEAENGMFYHEKVVRIMPGGAEGIAPVEGKLTYKAEIPLDDYRKQLNDGLDAYEDMYSNATGKDFHFPMRPIGPQSLQFIAFVQDDNTKEVLQSAMVSLQPTAAALEAVRSQEAEAAKKEAEPKKAAEPEPKQADEAK